MAVSTVSATELTAEQVAQILVSRWRRPRISSAPGHPFSAPELRIPTSPNLSRDS